jgi:hypothetical protein
MVSRTKKDSGLINQVSNDFVKNSSIIEKTLLTTKKLVSPISKSLDYAAVAIVSIGLYKLYEYYLF